MFHLDSQWSLTGTLQEMTSCGGTASQFNFTLTLPHSDTIRIYLFLFDPDLTQYNWAGTSTAPCSAVTHMAQRGRMSVPNEDPIIAWEACSIIAFDAVIKFANSRVANPASFWNMGHLLVGMVTWDYQICIESHWKQNANRQYVTLAQLGFYIFHPYDTMNTHAGRTQTENMFSSLDYALQQILSSHALLLV